MSGEPSWANRIIAAIGRLKVLAGLIVLRIGGALAAFLMTVILARVMTQADMGRALSLMSLAILLAVAVAGGLEAGAVRFVARYRETNDLALMRGYLALSRRVPLVLGGVCILAAGAVMATGGPTALALAFLAAALLGYLRVGAAHSLAFGRVTASLAPATLLRQCFLLLFVLTLAQITGALNVAMVLAAFLAANAAALAGQFVLNRNLGAEHGSGPPDHGAWREWVAYGLHMAPTLMFVQYSRDLTLIISALVLAPSDVAVLGVVTALTAFAKFAVAAVNQSVTPRMAKLVAASDTPALMELIRTSNLVKFWMIVAGIVLVFLFGEPVLGLFGVDFRTAHPILLILMIEPLALAVFGPAGQYLGLSGHQRLMIPMALFALFAMTIFIATGAWLAGLPGAALGAATSWVVWTAVLARCVYRLSGHDVTIIGTLRGRRS